MRRPDRQVPVSRHCLLGNRVRSGGDPWCLRQRGLLHRLDSTDYAVLSRNRLSVFPSWVVEKETKEGDDEMKEMEERNTRCLVLWSVRWNVVDEGDEEGGRKM